MGRAKVHRGWRGGAARLDREGQAGGGRDINMVFLMGNSVLHNFHLSGFEVPLVLQGESH